MSLEEWPRGASAPYQPEAGPGPRGACNNGAGNGSAIPSLDELVPLNAALIPPALAQAFNIPVLGSIGDATAGSDAGKAACWAGPSAWAMPGPSPAPLLPYGIRDAANGASDQLQNSSSQQQAAMPVAGTLSVSTGLLDASQQMQQLRQLPAPYGQQLPATQSLSGPGGSLYVPGLPYSGAAGPSSGPGSWGGPPLGYLPPYGQAIPPQLQAAQQAQAQQQYPFRPPYPMYSGPYGYPQGYNQQAGGLEWGPYSRSGPLPAAPQSTTGTADDAEEAAPLVKKSRLVWTPDLHQVFEDVVEKLGPDKAVPKNIMQEMNKAGIKDLTRENVASHLQKYRLQKTRMDSGASAENASNPTASTGPTAEASKLTGSQERDKDAVARGGPASRSTAGAGWTPGTAPPESPSSMLFADGRAARANKVLNVLSGSGGGGGPLAGTTVQAPSGAAISTGKHPRSNTQEDGNVYAYKQ